jgi:hypothetical protein
MPRKGDVLSGNAVLKTIVILFPVPCLRARLYLDYDC